MKSIVPLNTIEEFEFAVTSLGDAQEDKTLKIQIFGAKRKNISNTTLTKRNFHHIQVFLIENLQFVI